VCEGFAINRTSTSLAAKQNFERERKRRVSPAVNSRVQHQQQQQYGSSARNSASSGTHGWCRRNSAAAASAAGGRLGGEQIESNVVQQRQCDERLVMYSSSADDLNMDMITASVALDWESSSMVRSCRRSSLEALEFVEFDNRRKPTVG
jgi:hypothetical protein